MKRYAIGVAAIIAAAGFSVANAAPVNNHQNNKPRQQSGRPVVTTQRAHVVSRPTPVYSKPQHVVIVKNDNHKYNNKQHYAYKNQYNHHHAHNNCHQCNNNNNGTTWLGVVAGGVIAGTVLYALAN